MHLGAFAIVVTLAALAILLNLKEHGGQLHGANLMADMAGGIQVPPGSVRKHPFMSLRQAEGARVRAICSMFREGRAAWGWVCANPFRSRSQVFSVTSLRLDFSFPSRPC